MCTRYDDEEDDETDSQCSLFTNYDDGQSTARKRPLGSPELRDNEKKSAKQER